MEQKNNKRKYDCDHSLSDEECAGNKSDELIPGEKTHITLTCSKSTMETLEKGVKYIQS